MKIRIILVGLFCVAALRLSAVPSVAKDWGGIVLLVSTCEDVKRILNVTTCKAPFSTYRLKEETVVVSYAEFPCAKDGKNSPVYDTTPARFVTGITRNFHKPIPLSDLVDDKTKYKQLTTDFIGEIQYYNDDEGVNFHTVDGMLNSISYYPSKEGERKRCEH